MQLVKFLSFSINKHKIKQKDWKNKRILLWKQEKGKFNLFSCNKIKICYSTESFRY